MPGLERHFQSGRASRFLQIQRSSFHVSAGNLNVGFVAFCAIQNPYCRPLLVDRSEFKEADRAAYQTPSVAVARVLREDLVEHWSKEYPTTVRCFEEDFEACIAHLHCPPKHRRIIRTTNLLERLFGEDAG